MKKWPETWRIYLQAKAWRCRPSDILLIADAWDAHCYDSAVYLFGSELEAALEAVNEKTSSATTRKRERVIRKWLELPAEFRAPEEKAQSSAARPNRVIQELTESGRISESSNWEERMLGASVM